MPAARRRPVRLFCSIICLAVLRKMEHSSYRIPKHSASKRPKPQGSTTLIFFSRAHTPEGHAVEQMEAIAGILYSTSYRWVALLIAACVGSLHSLTPLLYRSALFIQSSWTHNLIHSHLTSSPHPRLRVRWMPDTFGFETSLIFAH